MSSGDVSLTMAVSSKYYVYPHNSEQFPTVTVIFIIVVFITITTIIIIIWPQFNTVWPQFNTVWVGTFGDFLNISLSAFGAQLGKLRIKPNK